MIQEEKIIKEIVIIYNKCSTDSCGQTKLSVIIEPGFAATFFCFLFLLPQHLWWHPPAMP